MAQAPDQRLAGGLSVHWAPLPPLLELERDWIELQAASDGSFFLSWTWISAWLASLPDREAVQLMVARREGQLTGLGLLVPARFKRFRFWPQRCWRLHDTGDKRLDAITIEANGFLVRREAADETRLAMLQACVASTRPCLKISAASSHYAALCQRLPAEIAWHAIGTPSYTVDLAQARRGDAGYLGLLGANRRAQVRSSMRGYARLGELRVEVAHDLDTARRFLAALRALHEATWGERGVTSDFLGSPANEAFHAAVIDRGLARGEVQLMRICAGSQDIGYLYNFVHGGRVSFYQSGLKYGLLDKHDRPGYVAHALAIQHNADAGHAVYDFLAGERGYKESLSTGAEQMHWINFERRTLAARLESVLRQWVRHRRERARNVSPA